MNQGILGIVYTNLCHWPNCEILPDINSESEKYNN